MRSREMKRSEDAPDSAWSLSAETRKKLLWDNAARFFKQT
jgi:hypothetical protein